jgi:hypothetical protein
MRRTIGWTRVVLVLATLATLLYTIGANAPYVV